MTVYNIINRIISEIFNNKRNKKCFLILKKKLNIGQNIKLIKMNIFIKYN